MGSPTLSSSSTNTELVKIKYEKRMLDVAQETLAMKEIAQRKTYKIRKGEGKTIEFTQYLPFDLVTSKLTEGDSGDGTTYTTLIKRAILEQWGTYTKNSDFLEFNSIDPGLTGLLELTGQNYAESVNLETMKQWAYYGATPMRADGDAANELHNVPVTAITSTSVFTATSLTGADDDWNTGRVTITKGPGYGESRIVHDYTATGDVVTIVTDNVWDTAITTDSEFSIAVGEGDEVLTAADKMTSTVIKRAVRQLRNQKAPTLKNGFYVCLIDADVEADLLGDTDWKNAYIHHASGKKGIFEGEINELWGVKFIRTTQPYRSEFVSGQTYAAAGAMHHVPFFGKNAIGMVDAAGQEDVLVLTPAEIADPALHMFSYIGWKFMFKPKPLNACWSVDMMCGATA